MNENKPQPKTYLQQIKPYTQGKSKVAAQVDKLCKLSSNENPYGASPKALAACKNFSALHRYPDGSAAALRRAIAETCNIPAEQITCGAGSDELIGLLVQAYAGAGDEVLYTQHGFLMYKIYTIAHGATPVVAAEKNLTADVDAILAAVTPRTKIVFLANPNNPTGTYLPQSEVQRLRDGLASHIILALDAAYAEYVLQDDYDAGIELVNESHENVVMLRTFSKIYGLSGLRLGWAYAAPSIIDTLNRIRSPFNVSAIAQEAGIAAVQDTEYTASMRDKNAHERAKLVQGLEKLGWDCVPSEGNFILVRFGDKTDAANEALQKAGVIVRDVVAYGLPEYLRISVGTADENDTVLCALQVWLDRSA